jgi:hypothetical protein
MSKLSKMEPLPCLHCGDKWTLVIITDTQEARYVHGGEGCIDSGRVITPRRVAQYNRRQPDPAIVEAWERCKRIGWGSGSTVDERDAANWGLAKAIKEYVEKGGG